jgi:hypothetical protein
MEHCKASDQILIHIISPEDPQFSKLVLEMAADMLTEIKSVIGAT